MWRNLDCLLLVWELAKHGQNLTDLPRKSFPPYQIYIPNFVVLAPFSFPGAGTAAWRIMLLYNIIYNMP
jgi:hypothetical protein